MSEPTPPTDRFGKTKSSIEVGVVLAAFIFLITLAFNSGIQYGQINTLTHVTTGNTADIRKLQTDVAAQNNQTNASLARIETLVEDLRSDQKHIEQRRAAQ